MCIRPRRCTSTTVGRCRCTCNRYARMRGQENVNKRSVFGYPVWVTWICVTKRPAKSIWQTRGNAALVLDQELVDEGDALVRCQALHTQPVHDLDVPLDVLGLVHVRGPDEALDVDDVRQ